VTKTETWQKESTSHDFSSCFKIFGRYKAEEREWDTSDVRQ